MKRYITLVKPGKRVLLFFLVSPFWLCDHAAAQVPPRHSEAKSQAPSDAKQKVYGYEAQRDIYLKEARQQITELENKIDLLKVKAKKSGATAKARMEKEIQGFESDLHDLDKKWTDLKNSGTNTWDDLKTALDTSIKKLREAIDGKS